MSYCLRNVKTIKKKEIFSELIFSEISYRLILYPPLDGVWTNDRWIMSWHGVLEKMSLPIIILKKICFHFSYHHFFYLYKKFILLTSTTWSPSQHVTTSKNFPCWAHMFLFSHTHARARGDITYYMRGVIYYESERSKFRPYNYIWIVKI